ncbi:MAG: hypothetical protein HGB19_05460 [Chlorobiales bacterium]|nr:hypothetical protein [Chlorobiales bacterium]
MSSARPVNWPNTLFFILTPFIALPGAVWWAMSARFHPATLVLAGGLWLLVGLSITAGYHRLFSHRSYQTAWPVKWLFVIFGSAAFEGSVMDWSTDHRRHHRYQDKEKDPYAIYKGFWFAHILWIFFKDWKPNPADAPDLWKDPVIRFQHRYFVPFASFMSFIFPMLVASLWGDPLGGLFVAGGIRLVLNQQFTFAINSFCHLIGAQPYSDRHTARDSWVTALITYGEGYHNFHHEFPADYRNGIRFYQWDPTKWLIYALSCVGLARNLHRIVPEKIVEKKILMLEKRLAEKLANQPPRLVDMSTQMLMAAKMQIQFASEKLTELRAQYETLKKEKNESVHYQLKELRLKLRSAQLEFHHSVEIWKTTTKGISRFPDFSG